jgi:choline-glycine betaine transporter
MSEKGQPKDHVEGASDYEYESEEGRASWQRLLFMLIVSVLFSVSMTVGAIVIILQFFWVLFTGETKAELEMIGRQLGDYVKDIMHYMTFNTDERPFPFDRDWPRGEA